jgi:hypothetical protein
MFLPSGRDLVQAMFESAIANTTPVFTLPDMPEDQPGAAEFNVFKREVARLIAEGHKGRFALIKGDRILSIWDTERDARQAGEERFGSDTFTVQEVQWYLKRLRWGYARLCKD